MGGIMIHLFHQWSKWQECVYMVWRKDGTKYPTTRQERRCLTCGKIQTESL